MPTLGAPLNFTQYEAQNLRVQNLGTAPAAPVAGQMYYDTASNTLFWYDGTQWVSAAGGVGTPPDATPTQKGIVQLAGDLAGTAALPQIAPGVITPADVDALHVDGLDNAAGMRTLGFTAGQAMPGPTTLDAVPTATATVNGGGQLISAIADPAAPQDAATKAYVDQVATGLDVHDSVRVASTADMTLSGNPTIDGVALVDGDRFLAKDQAAAETNGIYTVAAAAWTRSTDAAAWDDLISAYVFVEEGTTNADIGWVCTIDQGGTLETDPITFAQFTGVGGTPPTGGQGLTATGYTLDVGTTANSGITVNADDIQITPGGITRAMLAPGVPGLYTAANNPAATTWNIPQATHGLTAGPGLLVQISDVATGNVELPDITIAANGDVTILYGVAPAANAKQVVIIG